MKQFIICPNCGAIELADLGKREDAIFPMFVHYCLKCNYCIGESEWKQAKAISIKQPWAYLIASGIKDVENRTWRTNFRGKVLIHTGSKPDRRYKAPKENINELLIGDQWIMIDQSKLNLREVRNSMMLGCLFNNSAIIGSVEIVDCVINHESIWAEKTTRDFCGRVIYTKPIYNWVLANPILFETPVLNVKGKLSFFIPEIN